MIAAVADTHTTVWYPRLSANARQVIERAFQNGDEIGISSISLIEMIYLTEKARIPPIAVQTLLESLLNSAYPFQELPVDNSVARHMTSISRDEVPDMPDRIIAATGLRYNVAVISRDGKIRASRIQTIW